MEADRFSREEDLRSLEEDLRFLEEDRDSLSEDRFSWEEDRGQQSRMVFQQTEIVLQGKAILFLVDEARFLCSVHRPSMPERVFTRETPLWIESKELLLEPERRRRKRSLRRKLA